MRISEIMNSNVHTCAPSMSIRQCASIMRDEDIGFMPVVGDDGKIVGTVTDRDLCIRALADGKIDLTVGDIMSRGVVCANENDELDAAEQKLADAEVSRLPVVDGTGRPIGVVSLYDIARHEDPERVGAVLEAVKGTDHHTFH